VSYKTYDEHRSYWIDEVKIDRYRRALAEVLAPGATVLDLGTGTGLLGLLACEAGAGKVYAVESGPVAAVAHEVFERNGVLDRIEIIRGMTTNVTLPEAVDLIVGDQIGGFAYSAGVFKFYADAARRLLKPDGVAIPASFDLAVAAVEHPAARETIDTFASPVAGFDLGPIHELVKNSMRKVSLRDDSSLLSTPARVHSQRSTDDSKFQVTARLAIAHDGILDGVVGMFVAHMSPSVSMSNIPGHPDMMDRRWQDFFPMGRSVPVRAGDHVVAEIAVNPDSYLSTWAITVEGADGRTTRERRSSFEGDLLDPAKLRFLARRPVGVTALGRAALEAVAERSDQELDMDEVASRLAAAMPHIPRSEVDRMVRNLAAVLASGPSDDTEHQESDP
jgi:SAM-dependent methyltransferase